MPAQHDLPVVLHASDIFIRPSRSEGMGNSFIEAMAAGIPVIATQEGGISDFLFDEKKNSDKPTTGWAVSKDAPSEIAEAIADILARREKVEEVTKNSTRACSEILRLGLCGKENGCHFPYHNRS